MSTQATRARRLPSGWYPDGAEEIKRRTRAWESEAGAAPGRPYVAAVAPHAGWAFSGALAWRAVRGFPPGVACVLVCGGHTPPGGPVRFGLEATFATPLGKLDADTELREALMRDCERSGFEVQADEAADNTVEIQLPLIAARAPGAAIVWLRVPNLALSARVGELAFRAAAALGRRAVLLGSTDLTHYGPNYGFMPAGSGEKALRWVEAHNDRPILEAMAAMDEDAVVGIGEGALAACSSGAAAAAIGFARAAGVSRGEVLAYATSAATVPDASFVGYGAVAYPEPDGPPVEASRGG